MKLTVGDFLIPLASGSILSAAHGFVPMQLGEVQPQATNWYDFMGAENGESRINYLTIAVQLFFSAEYVQLLLLVVPYALIQTAIFERRFKLSNLQSILTSNAIARLSWEAPVAQLVQAFGLDYATRKNQGATFGQVAMSGSNKQSGIDILAFSAIFGLLRYFDLMK